LGDADLAPDILLNALKRPEESVAASWIIKALLESGRGRHLDMNAAFGVLAQSTDWATQLHLCQCVRYVPDAAIGHAATFRALINAKKTLVRVWALDAFVRLSYLRPELRDDAQELLAELAHDRSAAMRARVKNLVG
jgi:hypothetical protein